MANGDGIVVAAAGGIGCVWLLSILAVCGFWVLAALALAKFVFDWSPF